MEKPIDELNSELVEAAAANNAAEVTRLFKLGANDVDRARQAIYNAVYVHHTVDERSCVYTDNAISAYELEQYDKQRAIDDLATADRNNPQSPNYDPDPTFETTFVRPALLRAVVMVLVDETGQRATSLAGGADMATFEKTVRFAYNAKRLWPQQIRQAMIDYQKEEALKNPVQYESTLKIPGI